jgi:fructose-bisphosphate aldolase class II
VDVFAPSIGNAHGSYRSAPKLDVERVTQLVEARSIPIALHGGSGLTPEQFADLISRGCAKVNISTALKEAYMKSSLGFLQRAEQENRWDPPSLFRHTRSEVVSLVVDLAKQFGSAGKGGGSCPR